MEKDLAQESRTAAVAHANGTLALEGLYVTKEAREDQLSYIRGEISAEEGLARAGKRHNKNI